MKPPVFEYVAARSLDEAIEALQRSDGEGKVLAGGQSLTPMLNFRLVRPSKLVDINRIPELDRLQENKNQLSIGTLVRHRTIETSPVVRKHFPILAAAAEHVGHLAIRNRGTFGGSIAHNDPAAEWPMLALLLDAEVETRSPSGSRKKPIRDFLVTFLTTALEDAEVVTTIHLPSLPAGTGWGFEELSRRPGDFGLAMAGALLSVEKGVCKDARIAMGGVGPTAMRAPEAEQMLRGQRPEPELLKRAGAKAAEASDPSNDVHASAEYRRHLVSVLATRALTSAAQRAAQA